MPDLRAPRLLYIKAGLFVIMGLLAAGLLVVEHPTLKVAGLLVLAIWAFARAYYFAFYVVEHYVDGTFRYAGLGSFVRHWLSSRTHRRRDQADHWGN